MSANGESLVRRSEPVDKPYRQPLRQGGDGPRPLAYVMFDLAQGDPELALSLALRVLTLEREGLTMRRSVVAA